MGDQRLLDEAEIVLVIDHTTLQTLQALISSCNVCDPGRGTFSVEMILDQITGSNPTATSYFLGQLLSCPFCGNMIHEDSLVGLKRGTDLN